MPHPLDDDADLKTLQRTLKRLSFPDVAEGHNIHEYFGKRVIEHKTSNGKVLAIKIVSPAFDDDSGVDGDRSEAALMHYAATHGVLAPKVLGIYDIVTTNPLKPLAVAVVCERVPGSPLAHVWHELNEVDKKTIVADFREALKRVRCCTQPYIGRPEKTPTRNIYDRLPTTYCGPFESEEVFDRWCLERVPIGFWGMQRKKWTKWAEKERRTSSEKFVLTHGDLSPRNIMVHNGRLSGIIDWERGGFFPEYAEFAFAMKLGHQIEKWWIPVLGEVLPHCSTKRLEFTRLVENRGW